MLLVRRLVPFLVVPLLVLLESTGWYLSRTVLWPYLAELTADPMGPQALLNQTFLLSGAGALLGGLAGLLLGPWGVLPLALLTAASLGLVPLAPPGMVTIPIFASTLGMGAVRASVWGVAVVELAAPREGLRSAVAVLIYAAQSTGILFAPWIAELLRQSLSVAAQLYGVTLILLLSAGLSVVPLVFLFMDREPRADTDRSRHLHLPTLLASVGLLLLVAPVLTLLSMGTAHLWTLIYGMSSESSWIAQLNPLVILLLAPVLAGVLVGLHLGTQRTLPALWIAGPGLIFFAAGLSLGLLGSGSLLLVAASLVAVAVGEVLTTPFLLSRVLGDLHWRALTLVAAAWIALQAGVWSVVDHLPGLGLESVDTATGWIGVAGATALGLALAIAALPLERRVYSLEEPCPESSS